MVSRVLTTKGGITSVIGHRNINNSQSALRTEAFDLLEITAAHISYYEGAALRKNSAHCTCFDNTQTVEVGTWPEKKSSKTRLLPPSHDSVDMQYILLD
jgi:hypothetical protein